MKVVVVEDQVLFREFLVNLLEKQSGYEVAGIADNGHAALELIRKVEPELVLLDILIPDLSGIQVARTVLKERPRTRIIAISSETDIKTIYQVHQLQLAGFIDKNKASVSLLLEALEAVRSGKRFVSDSLRQSIRKLRADPLGFQKILTRREQEVLTLIGGGLSDAEIGRRLGLSDSSVQSHRSNLSRKLGVHSTPELIRYAQESGFWKADFRKMNLIDTYHIHE